MDRNVVSPGSPPCGDLGHDNPLTVSDIFLEVGKSSLENSSVHPLSADGL